MPRPQQPSTGAPPRGDAAAVAAYLDAAPLPARDRLRALADAVRAVAPDATERIAYGLPTWHQGENLIHLGAFAHHVGIYPGAAAIAAFADALQGFPTSKGAIQVPHDAPLPVALVQDLTRFRLGQAALRPPKPSRRRAAPLPSPDPAAPPDDIAAYHQRQAEADFALCEALFARIRDALPDATAKVWHRHPVFFLTGNPVVGYSVHAEGVRLLFWSGQSFDEPALRPVGSFRAAEARFGRVDDLDDASLRRWLAKARDIQWDYQHVAKRKGVLVRR